MNGLTEIDLKTTTIEECVDQHLELLPCLNLSPEEVTKHSGFAQGLISLQSLYISQRERELNTNVRLLPLSVCQQIFYRLYDDCSNDNRALILFFCMVTAIPVSMLIKPNFFSENNNLKKIKDHWYIENELPITKQLKSLEKKLLNDDNVVRLPLPGWLMQRVQTMNFVPKLEQIRDYIKILRKGIDCIYLSIGRIESILHMVMARYVDGGNTHIADLICRIPPPYAPAIYYSSHENKQLMRTYKHTLQLLNREGNFDLGYFDNSLNDYRVGSSFVLNIQAISKVIICLKDRVLHSSSKIEIFNHLTMFVWFAICLLTGIRPNNDVVGTLKNADLEQGWLIINDKPSKAVKNHRLVPLCESLVNHIKFYLNFLNKNKYHAKFKQNDIFDKFFEIISSEEHSLLNFLSDDGNRLSIIKRKDIYGRTQDIIDLNPYFTRHFFRTFLEEKSVSMHLINAIIGHEKNNQEVMNQFSSCSKNELHDVRIIIEEIAQETNLDYCEDFSKQVEQLFFQLP